MSVEVKTLHSTSIILPTAKGPLEVVICRDKHGRRYAHMFGMYVHVADLIDLYHESMMLAPGDLHEVTIEKEKVEVPF